MYASNLRPSRRPRRLRNLRMPVEIAAQNTKLSSGADHPVSAGTLYVFCFP